MSAADDITAIVQAAPPGALRKVLAEALTTDNLEAWRTLAGVAGARKTAAQALYRAALRAHQRRHPAQERLLAAALSLEPFHVAATGAMARSYLERGLAPQALKLLLDLRKHQLQQGRKPHNYDGLLLACARTAGQAEDARAAAYRLAAAPRAKWEDRLAAGEFFRAENDLDAQRTLFTRMTRARPHDVRANLLMAAWLHDEGYDDEAARYARRAQKFAQQPDHAAQARRLLFGILHPQDEAEFREITGGFYGAEMAEVAPRLERLVRSHPDFGEAWLFLGFALRRLRRLKEAAHAFDRAVALTDDPNAHKELGGVLGELGAPRESLRHTLRAIELMGEKDKVLWLNLAAASLELGDLAACEQALGRARELDPHSRGLARLEQELASRSIPRRGFFNARRYRVKAGAA